MTRTGGSLFGYLYIYFLKNPEITDIFDSEIIGNTKTDFKYWK
jgi:hypothetical protein